MEDGKKRRENGPTTYVVDNDDYESGVTVVEYRLQAADKEK